VQFFLPEQVAALPVESLLLSGGLRNSRDKVIRSISASTGAYIRLLQPISTPGAASLADEPVRLVMIVRLLAA
jgi:hypothetical protein